MSKGQSRNRARRSALALVAWALSGAAGTAAASKEFEVTELAPGVVVFLPKERIVATGDLLVHPSPFGIGSYYEEWIATLGKLDALPVDVLFPGHGSIQRDPGYLHTIQGLLRGFLDEVRAAVASGATLEQTQERVTLAAWQEKIAGDDPAKQRAFTAFFVQPAVERAWRQAKGEPDTIDRLE